MKSMLFLVLGSLMALSQGALASDAVVQERECRSVSEVCVTTEQESARFGYYPDFSGSIIEARSRANAFAAKTPNSRVVDEPRHRAFVVYAPVTKCSLRCN